MEGWTQAQIAQELGLATSSAASPMIKKYAALVGINHDMLTVTRRAALRKELSGDAAIRTAALMSERDWLGEVVRSILLRRLSHRDTGRTFALSLLTILASLGWGLGRSAQFGPNPRANRNARA